MRKSGWIKSTVMVAGLCLGGFAAHAQQQDSSQQTGDPVADAARKAREEKKNATKPKRVFTDDDIKPATPEKPEIQNATAAGATATTGAAATTGTGASPGAAVATGAQKAADAQKKEDPNSQSAWRKRFSEQREKIARAEKEVDVLQRELDKSQTQYYADPQKAMTQQNTRSEINDKTAKLAAKKQELEQLRQELDDMETELRKAGGDPGWAQ